MEEKNPVEQSPAKSLKIEPQPKTNLPSKSTPYQFRFLLGILGVVVVVAVVFKIYNLILKNTQSTLQPTPTPTETPTVTPTPKPTFNWKIYKDPESYYSIEYLEEMWIDKYENWVSFIFAGPKQGRGTELYDGFGIKITEEGTVGSQTSLDFAQKEYMRSQENIQSGAVEGDLSQCRIEKITRDGVEGSRLYRCEFYPGPFYSEWFVYQNKVIRIDVAIVGPYEAIFKQMFSSFKFLSSNSCQTCGY